jgi:hypothetical protein
VPRQVTAYLCAFKCGRRSVVNIKAMAEHEKRCSLNPERRSCKACEHNVRDEDGIACAIDAFPPEQAAEGWKLAYDCPSWLSRAAISAATGQPS